MKIAVVAANGKAARKIISEAVNRGMEVTAFGRRDNNTEAQHYVKKDIFDLTKEDLAGFDAVVDAFGAWTEETLPMHSTSLAHLSDILSGSDTRLLVVGGAGSLYTDASHKLMISEAPDFPDEYNHRSRRTNSWASGACLSSLPPVRTIPSKKWEDWRRVPCCR